MGATVGLPDALHALELDTALDTARQRELIAPHQYTD